MSYPDTPQVADALHLDLQALVTAAGAAGQRLRDQHTLSATLEAQAAAAAADRDAARAEAAALRADLAAAAAERDDLRRAWWPDLRAELARPEYAAAAGELDAAAVYALLTAPVPTRPDPVPVPALSAAVNLIQFRLLDKAADVQQAWGRRIPVIRDILARLTDGAPRAELPGVLGAAVADGLLSDAEAAGVGTVVTTRLARAGLAGRVATPADVRAAMGW